MAQSSSRRNPAVVAPTDDEWHALKQAMETAVRRACPTWGNGERDDLVQAALVRLMDLQRKSLAKGEGKREFSSSYLYRVAHSTLIDEIRRRKRRAEIDLEAEGTQAELPHGNEDPLRDVEATEVGIGIQECMSEMKKERRSAVTLYLLGHSVPESARILGWAAKRTENLVYRGLADLRSCLEGKGLRP